jgi:anion-transporting  ArsA/GET3 family ATPase
MDLQTPHPPLVIVVGSGGVGKTTLAAAMGLVSADAGHETLVMTFDPSRRLKDALGVEAAGSAEVEVPGAEGPLYASLLDARATFDRLVERYAPDPAARDRILENRYYDHLAGHLGGLLEYMAVERLYEVSIEGRYARVVLDTPPTREAIDFLEAPQRVVDFLDSGALKIALRPWFDGGGKLRFAPGMGLVSRSLESFLDRIVGLQLLRDMSEFFQAFEPLFEGFRRRAVEVRGLLTSPSTRFVLVTGPGEQRIADTLYFARRLREAGFHLGPVVVNRVHPELGDQGHELFDWLGGRHQVAFEELRRRLTDRQSLVALPMMPHEPTDLSSLLAVGKDLQARLLE